LEHEFREDDGIDSIGGIEGVDIIKLQIGEGDKLSRPQVQLTCLFIYGKQYQQEQQYQYQYQYQKRRRIK
jgi:predicted restriction endonuclease